MNARIIVIDNYQTLPIALIQHLQTSGYEVLRYDYNHIGLTALERLHPDLVILDFNAQDAERGWEFLKFLKLRNETTTIPVIVTATSHLSETVKIYLVTHFIPHVYAPFDAVTFLPLVQRTLTLASQTDLS
jgi:CheY-like chemotaxis protein